MSLVEEQILTDLQAQLRRRLPEALYEQWFAGTEIAAWDGDRLELGVKNRFFKNWIETKYLDVLRDAAAEAMGKPVAVTVAVSARLYAPFREAQERERVEAARTVSAPELSAPAAPARRRVEGGLELNADFTFDAFVTGPSNRLSQAVALCGVESPGEYGRLYFCGQHGVGKTHLLQAMCHETRRRRPDAAVMYVTGEKFMADFVAAHAGGKLAEFRAAYSGCDLLAVDQLQVLGQGNKAATQAELLGIIDQLQTRGGQMVFAATLAPDELEGVDARLRDRFGAGFVDRLSLPDEETRRRLVERKMAERGLVLPEGAVRLMAREMAGNVRQLEGKVNRLAALMRIEGMEATTSCIRMALEVSTPEGKRSVLTMGDVVRAVAEEFGVEEGAVRGRGRGAVLCRARGLAAVLCRRLLGMRYAELGAELGGRSHATVMTIIKGIPEEVFSSGLEGRRVERIMFRLGVNMKPEEVLERQRGLFE